MRRLHFLHFLPFLLCCFASLALAADPPAPTVTDFALFTHDGRLIRLSEQRDVPVVVLYSHAVGCPIVRQQLPELAALERELPGQVRVLLIDAAAGDERGEVGRELAELKSGLSVLMDDSQCVAEDLGYVRSGEAVVVTTADLRLRWRGPVDDRLGYGAQKPKANRAWLREAVDAVLAQQEPPTGQPAVKGCAYTFQQARDKHRPDYAKDIAPLLTRSCVDCHSDGGIGPFAMDGHKRVAGRSAAMREAILAKTMPPWHADPAHGRFANDRGLSPADVRTLVHWIEHGAVIGAGDDPLAKPRAPMAEWPLGPPDLIVDLPEQAIPATGTLPYRKASVSVALPKDRWVRAVDLRPSSPQVLHHAFAFLAGEQDEDQIEDIASRMTANQLERVRAEMKRRGISPEDIKKRQAGGNRQQGLTTFFASYVPGQQILPFPEGTGKRVPADPTFDFQLHYTTSGAAVVDRPRLGLYFHRQPPARELKVTSAFQMRLDIPPGARGVPAEAERPFQEAVRLFALSPHMHFRGESMRFTARLPNGKEELLLSVPDYRLDWQATYVLAKPKDLPAGTVIRVEGTYDNSPWNDANPDPGAQVRFGEQSSDEMFIGYLVYTPAAKPK
ncbi:MAG: redoxin domain-containing protein [Planctomycetes bacterium]|nr:redoxin domain-containing protein [Planctomycetota bacterium]